MTQRGGKKKKKKQRGKRTFGRGNTKKGRGKGTKKRNTSAKRKNKAKKGFTSHKKEEKGINLRDLKKYEEDGEIDVTKHGYDKVLGSGEINKPLTIKAKNFSKSAKNKIEEANGEAIEKVDE